MKQGLLLILLPFCLLNPKSLLSQTGYSDCFTAMVLCEKNPVLIEQFMGAGTQVESHLGSCFQASFTETNSMWLKWEVAQGGTLGFTILPINENDDIDFALYRLSDWNSCKLKETMRCMSAGPNLGLENTGLVGCTGATGLRHDASQTNQSAGCREDSDNFLSEITVSPGEQYALFIHNYRASSGAFVEWSGTANFQSIPGECIDVTSPVGIINETTGIQFSGLYPNPSTDVVGLDVKSDEEHSGLLQLIGANGQVELEQPFHIQAGQNHIEFSIVGKNSGVHFIKLKSDSLTKVFRFVKQ